MNLKKLHSNKPFFYGSLGVAILLLIVAGFYIQKLITYYANSTEYFEVQNSCNFEFVGDCVNVRSGPGEKYSIVTRLRNGVVLEVADRVQQDGRTWYKIGFGQELIYPERVSGGWYVAADLVRTFRNEGDVLIKKGEVATTKKRIVVDLSEEKLFAYDGDQLFMEESISTGLDLTPTDLGTFQIFKMTPSRFMQGPIPGVSDQVYDLPGVPWDLYFTGSGAAIHGAYWHNHFGEQWSHGCVNLPVESAKKLYSWAEIGTKVIVQN
ncbi:MAG: L,D-transpeptidase family protein [Patescibacteria group bacterium]